MEVQEKATKKFMRDLLTKKPFTRVMPTGHYDHGDRYNDVMEESNVPDYLHRKIVTQADFVRELDPAGHLINDRGYYPDIWRQDPETGLYYLEEVKRYAFSFQKTILTKQLVHLTGNDIRFELVDKRDDEAAQEVYNAFRRGWDSHNMQVAWYQLAKSVKSTGDGAFCGFLDNGTFGWKVFSFNNGDELYPHYDARTGKLNCFARTYSNYDKDGTIIKRFVEVWDDKYFYLFSAEGDAKTVVEKIKEKIAEIFNLDGYTLIEQTEHGFDSIPIAYQRDDNGACWSNSQEAIDNYEFAFSRLAQSNSMFALPIMYVKGEGSQELSKKDMTHASKVIFLPEDGEVGFLKLEDASNAYKAELDMLEEEIYSSSFCVKPPELKSGDLPGVSLKILYSPAYEKAICDAQEYDGTIDKMVDIFTFGYGLEAEMRLEFQNTPISHFVEPYIHLNTSEETTCLAALVQNKIISHRTASEKSYYATPQEYSRLQNEQHEAEMNELMLEEKKLEIQTDAQIEAAEAQAEVQSEVQIEQMEAQAKINEKEAIDNNGGEAKKANPTMGGKANTGGRKRGRTNRSGRIYDQNGNWQGRDNWSKYNTASGGV